MSAEASPLDQYLYHLPEEKIAKHPLEDRDASKLLFYKDKKISHLAFRDCVDLVPEGATLFLNNTKVISARLFFYKDTGAKIEVFLTEPIAPHPEFQKALKATHSSVWKCMIGNLKKWKDDQTLTLKLKDDTIVRAKLIDKDKNHVEFSWDNELEFLEIIESAGHVPLPPYLNRSEEKEDKERYQTVFSALEGAVAAPTAGLHFTDEILAQLASKGVKKDEVTLHVSAGTFRPIKVDDFTTHDMHNERIIVQKENIESILSSENARIAVGTTAMRTLESTYWYGVKLHFDESAPFFIDKTDAYSEQLQGVSLEKAMNAILKKMETSGTTELKGETEIFIYPGYDFKVVNGLFTNFHQPSSTLILLVAAFIGEDWRKIYDEALSKDYRFLSYGDTSLLMK
jgi:S-adenosylmethionine:tRNA ribosyltransferase-isomerase